MLTAWLLEMPDRRGIREAFSSLNFTAPAGPSSGRMKMGGLTDLASWKQIPSESRGRNSVGAF